MISKTYPHKCKLCHSPARIGKIVLCSNYKCKVSKTYRSVLAKIKPIMCIDGRDRDGFLICPSCGDKANGAVPLGDNNQKLICRGCTKYWEVEVQAGDRLYRTGFYFEWVADRAPTWTIRYWTKP